MRELPVHLRLLGIHKTNGKCQKRNQGEKKRREKYSKCLPKGTFIFLKRRKKIEKENLEPWVIWSRVRANED